MLRYMTSGESHGRCMLAILDGIPSGLLIDKRTIDKEMARRMSGYGRGKRMAIERDKAQILSGLRKARTIGSPITIMVGNVDHSIDTLAAVFNPRPGHADLSGVIKYDLSDIRSVLERASARDTVAKVGAGAICKILLGQLGARITSHVVSIGGVEADVKGLGFKRIEALSSKSPVRCADPLASCLMCEEIDRAMEEGDSLGGVFEIIASGVVPGIGSYSQWDRRLDASLARAIMAIPAIKGVEFGLGFAGAKQMGSMVHDQIFHDKRGFFRKTNYAGGIEGGMTNGEDIVIRAAMKPISTLKTPLSSVNIKTKRPVKAAVQRADVCAVPAAGVIGEAAVAIELASAMLEKFGGDSITEMRRNFNGYVAQVRRF